jgi:hypothetical protein
MLRKFRVLILFALAALAWNVTPAYSTTVTYTDLASFQAASTGDQTIDFTGTTGDYSNVAGLVQQNVRFVGISTSAASGYSLQVLNTSLYSWDNFGTGEALTQTLYYANGGTPPVIHVVFSTPVTAFGTNLFTHNDYAMDFGITVLGTQYTAQTNMLPSPAFWGITSDTPISSADFTVPAAVWNTGTNAFLDNFTYGTAQAQGPPPPDVPEAATFLLIGSGLLGLAILGKKMRPAQFV